VLLIDDQTSGVGAILDKTRLQGILRGTPSGEVVLEKVMSDETVPPGEQVLTSGGDGIFPKGLLVGRVTKVSTGSDLFLNIRVRPSANLSKLEEVLVVTKIDERQAQPDQSGTARAADILAGRLPTVPATVPAKPENAEKDAAPSPAAPRTAAPTTAGSDAKPKAASPEASASSGPPAVRKTAPPASSPGTSSGAGSGTSSGTAATPAGAAAGTAATKASPKPEKPAVQPKPQPAVQDSPQ